MTNSSYVPLDNLAPILLSAESPFYESPCRKCQAGVAVARTRTSAVAAANACPGGCAAAVAPALPVVVENMNRFCYQLNLYVDLSLIQVLALRVAPYCYRRFPLE